MNLVEFLRERKYCIVETIDIGHYTEGMTEGYKEWVVDRSFDVIDFDNLVDAIDEFSRTFAK